MVSGSDCSMPEKGTSFPFAKIRHGHYIRLFPDRQFHQLKVIFAWRQQILSSEGGRGIMIMVSWMDKVIYNRKGNEVMLMKRLSRVDSQH